MRARIALVGLGLCVGTLTPSAVVAAPIKFDSGTGATNHWYDIIGVTDGITWDDAKLAAEASGGYLATLLSEEENNFVFSSLADSAAYWTIENPQSASAANIGPWLGGFQLTTGVEPGGGWTWLNGDGAFAFTNWHQGEPGNGQNGESALHYFEYNGRGSTWNDLPQGTDIIKKPIAYVIEYNSLDTDVTAVPEPTSLVLLGIGLGSASIARRRRRRESHL